MFVEKFKSFDLRQHHNRRLFQQNFDIRQYVFSSIFFATFTLIFESISLKCSHFSIATFNITSKSMKKLSISCSFTFSISFSRTFVSKHQKFYFIIDNLIRMFREKSKSFDLRQYQKKFASSQYQKESVFSQCFDINSFCQSRFLSHQSRIIFYFMFTVNQKISISQNLKSSKSKNFQQHTFAKSIRIVFVFVSVSVFVLFEKSIKLSYKTFDVFGENSFFIFIFFRFFSIFLFVFAFVSIIFVAKMSCIIIYQQVISIIDRVNIEFVVSRRNWEKTKNKRFEHSITKHFHKKFIAYTFCWMQCTHSLSHVRKYQCVNRCCVDSINMTKLLVSLYNRFDVARIQRLH